VKFDHQRDARFALDAQHEKLQCSACHRAYQTAQGSVVRFKPLGVTCAECHDPRRKGGDR
jgi:Zn finger protein HypA/HybF involved in hydrogenase expression